MAGSAAEEEREAEGADSAEVEGEVLGPAVDSLVAVDIRWEVRRRSVVRVVVARRHVPQHRLLAPIQEQLPVRDRVAAAEISEQEIVRQLNRRIVRVPVRDRVPPHCRRIDPVPVPEPDKELALAKALRIDQGAGPVMSSTTIELASRNNRHVCRGWEMPELVRGYRIKVRIDHRRSKLGKAI